MNEELGDAPFFPSSKMLSIPEIRVIFDLKPFGFDARGNPVQNLSTKSRSHRFFFIIIEITPPDDPS